MRRKLRFFIENNDIQVTKREISSLWKTRERKRREKE